ncbi:MAG: hypothetical protein E7600_07600 [Ruminococcaceae bacterium]|nr:hypothetical protein [Oscillospiraceae bacterium]
MKRIIALLLAAVLATALIACSANKDDDVTDPGIDANGNDVTENNAGETVYEEADLAAIADSLYDGIAEDQRPFVMSMPLTSEDFEFFTFVPYEEGLEAVANEPMMSSIAHSIVLVKAPTAEKAQELAKAMKENCDPRKWMCVEADIVETVTNKNLAMLLMTTTEGGMSETILKNFNALDEKKVASLKSQAADVESEENFENFEDEFVDDELTEGEVITDDENVVVDLPSVDVDDVPAAGFEEENVPAVMPEVTPEVDETPSVTPEIEETPAVEETVSDVTIDDLYALTEKLYEGINPEDMPMVGTMELDSESFEYSAFVPYKDSYLAVENMPMMGSQPHSVVIVKADSAAEAQALAAEMEANADPRKWICVSARSVKSASKGNLAILVMTSVEVMPGDDIDEAAAEEMSNTKSEERAQLIIDNFLANA